MSLFQQRQVFREMRFSAGKIAVRKRFQIKYSVKALSLYQVSKGFGRFFYKQDEHG